MSVPPLDLNVDHYTNDELLTILGLTNYDPDAITIACNHYIDKYEQENNRNMMSFFMQMNSRLLLYTSLNLSSSATNTAKQTSTWWRNQALSQENAPLQTAKITDRKQKISVFNNDHVPMNREHLGINNAVDIPVAQDTLNPNLKNITSRIIVLDSQYREVSANESSTNFSLELSEPLLNVISLRLYSIQVPYAWYLVDSALNNHTFQVHLHEKIITVVVANGNYNANSFCTAVQNGVIAAGFILPEPSIIIASINPNSCIFTLNLVGCSLADGTVVNESSIIVFYTPGIGLFNNTLGYTMGFRSPGLDVNPTGNVASAIINLTGTKYFILILDDLNQNHINSGLIGISEGSRYLKVPSYFTPSQVSPTATITAEQRLEQQLQDPLLQLGTGGIDSNASILLEKYAMNLGPVPQVVPTYPRTLTQPQIYSINEILKNNAKTTNYMLRCPTNSDTFAVVPIKMGNAKTGDMYVEFGGSLQDNKRIYFGPVNMDRLRIKLLDDKGNVVNLNGADWSITVISENLYQY